MNRKSFLRHSAFTAGGLLIAQQHLLANLWQQPAWKIIMLDDKTGIFTERGGTILFSFTNEGIVVVDSQFPDQSKHLIDELKKQKESPFKLLINTHHHGDHSSGNISFKDITEHVLAHENSKANQVATAQKAKTEDKQLYPDITYTDVYRTKIGGETICLYYLGAGHTNGDSFVHFENANIVHTGDLLFNRRHPFVDRSAGANIKSWITVMEKAQKKFSKKTKFVFGHAADGYEVTGSMDDLKAFQNYLYKTLSLVDKEIKAGKTKEEILKITTIPGAEEWKGDGIQRPLTAAYEELTTK